MSWRKPSEVDWDIREEGRAWKKHPGEAMERYRRITEFKLEMIDGKLLWDDDSRLMLAGLLIENLGADAVVRLGDPAVWRAAVAKLPEPAP